MDVLKNGKIRITQASCFNDPFELLINIESLVSKSFFEIFKNQIKENAKDIDNEFVESSLDKLENLFTKPPLNANIQISEMLRQQFDKNHGILSLTKNPKNLLMWSHYSKDHTGFLIGFNEQLWKTDITKYSDFSYSQFYKVNYSKTRPKYSALIDKNNFEIDDCFEDISFDKFYKTVLTTKSNHWKYEQEYRLILDLKKIESNKINENGVDLFFAKLPANFITSIILGVNIKPELKNEIQSILKEDKYSHIKLFKTELDLIDYKLIQKRIN